jgi:ribonuclease HI
MGFLPKVELFCDGACLGNPGPGGWAYILRAATAKGPHERTGQGGEADTTNNRMELMAVIQGLEALTRPCQVHLVGDSQYVLKGIDSWLAGWKRKGWRKADGGAVLNVDLWQRLDAQLSRHRIETTWVRGHQGHPENERVDRMAREAAEGFIQGAIQDRGMRSIPR